MLRRRISHTGHRCSIELHAFSWERSTRQERTQRGTGRRQTLAHTCPSYSAHTHIPSNPQTLPVMHCPSNPQTSPVMHSPSLFPMLISSACQHTSGGRSGTSLFFYLQTTHATEVPQAVFFCASPGMRQCVSRKEPARRSHHVKYSACMRSSFLMWRPCLTAVDFLCQFSSQKMFNMSCMTHKPHNPDRDRATSNYCAAVHVFVSPVHSDTRAFR